MEGATEASLRPQDIPQELRGIGLVFRPRGSSVLASFALSRILLAALTLVLGLVFRHNPLQLWSTWDGQWYAGIALHGYHWSIHGKPALAFFPLFPLLMHMGTAIGVPAAAAGIIVGNAAYIGALFYLYRWVDEAAGGRHAARTIWIMSFLPTAFFFVAPYSESLALLCSVAALYHARRHQALLAGLWTCAGVLTRPTGLIVLLAVAACLLREPWGNWGWRSAYRWSQVLHGTLPSLIGLATYLWYLTLENIGIQGLLTAQQSWHRSLTYPWTGFTASLQWLVDHSASNLPWATENALQLSVTVIFLALTACAWRDLDTPSRLYCAGFWAVVLVSPEWRDAYYAPFSSMDRFVLLLFPLYAWLAGRSHSIRWSLVLPAGGLAMVAVATVHMLGGWVG